jgi:PEP-CTERM motif
MSIQRRPLFGHQVELPHVGQVILHLQLHVRHRLDVPIYVGIFPDLMGTERARRIIPASDYAAIDAFAAANGLMADVPEPTSFGVLGLAAVGVLARRRRTALTDLEVP